MTRTLRAWGLAFLVPGLALYLFIVIWPSIQVVNNSLFAWTPGLPADFVGLGNFVRIFSDPVFMKAIGHTFVLLAGALIIQIPIGLLIALILHRRGPRTRDILQTAFFIPMILSSAVIAVLFIQVYAPQFGLLNTILRAVGLESLAKPWLGDPSTALLAVVAVIGWQFVGLYMLIFMAALRRIPPAIYEAGELDGAVGFHRLRHITLPLIFDSVKLSVMLVITGAVQYFNLIWAMTKGGPANESNVLASYMFVKSFQDSQPGYGAAVAAVMLAINLVLAIALQAAFKRDPIELG